MNEQIVDTLRETFGKVFGLKPQFLARAPGRANIIGEHIDYNGGFVLPVGIDKNVYAWVSKRDDDEVRVFAGDFGEMAEFSLDDLVHDDERAWADYQKGVIDEVQKAGHALGGLNMAFAGDVPVAAGLSSSAAVELLTGVVLDHLFDLQIERMELVKLCQGAERNFVGVQCGIMDQFASGMAKKNHAMLLDCKTLEYRLIPFSMDRHYLVLCNTLKKRELVGSEYNERRAECERGLEFFKKLKPEVEFLCDVTPDLFAVHKGELPESTQRRCAHAIGEQQRVRDCVAALEQGRSEEVGRLLYESHESLKDLYEVSCDELDVLVDLARTIDGCLGSRLMGAGFGGCTINLVEKTKIGAFSKAITLGYREATSITPEIYICEIEDGAQVFAE